MKKSEALHMVTNDPERATDRILELERKVRFETLPDNMLDYPNDIFRQIMRSGSPYAFYFLQWVPYQTEAKRYRLKMLHDVKSFSGEIQEGVWPNGDRCGKFHDSEVEFIRISKKQYGAEG